MKPFIVVVVFSLSGISWAQVGINTTSPNAQLDIRSSNQVTPASTDGMLIPKVDTFPVSNPTVAQQGMLVYLTTASGTNVPGFYYWDNTTLTWIPVGNNNNSGWNLTGNSGTNPTTNFIGTTDDQDLVIRRNNVISGRLGTSNNSYGMNALVSNTLGVANTANGVASLQNNSTGSANTAYGRASLENNSAGNFNTATGRSALSFNTFGNFNTAFGGASLDTNITGAENTAIGYNSDVISTNLVNATAIGARAVVNSNNALVLGSVNGVNGATSSVNVGIGTIIPLDRLHVVGNIRMVDGNQAAGRVLTSDANGAATWQNASANAWGLTGNSGTNPATNFIGTTDAQPFRFRTGNASAGNISNTATGLVSLGLNAGSVNTGLGNTFIGGTAGLLNTTGASNTFIGQGAGAANTNTANNTYVGTGAGASNTTGQENVYVGRGAGGSGTSGSSNILIGNGAGFLNTANNNVMIGSFAGNANSSGGGNTFMGSSAGAATSTGGQNTFIGTAAGLSNTTGTQNTLIGNGAAVNTNNLTNATAIGRGSRVDVNDGLVLGSVNGINAATSTSLVGIGTTAPVDRLHVVGNIRMVDGNQAAGRVLISDVNGTASWQNASANAWGLTGNAGLTNLTNFIGTTDATMLLMKTDNIDRMRILANGNIEIGGAPIPNLFEAGTPKLLVGSESSSTDNLTVWAAHSTAAGRSTLNLARQRGSFSTTLPVSNGDGLGELVFSGYNNTVGTHLNAALVFADVDGTLAAGNVPAKLGFSTAPDTGGAPIERMTIRANGNLGIGTSIPQEKLQVAGRALFTNGFSADNAALLYRNNTDYMFVGPQSGSSANGAAMALFGTTNVSGGNAGGVDFNVPNGQVRMSHTGGNYVFRANSTSGYTATFELNDDALELGHNSAARSIVFNTASVERMRLSPTGFLGVGTNNPLQKVHVSGPAGLTAVRIANTSTTGSTSNVALDFFRNTAINTDWRIYNIGANLTIGNSADDLTTVNDLYQFQGGRFMPMTDATINLGQAANRWNTVFASNGTINTSDARQKKNIQNLNYGLIELLQLRPVSFEWKKDDGSGTKLGLIAQELQQVLPEVVRDWDWVEDEQGNRTKQPAEILGVYYSDLIPVLIKSIQEQQQIIQQQKGELEQLKAEVVNQNTLILERLQVLEKK